MSSSVPKIEEIILDKKGTGLGFNIRGGIDNQHVGHDSGIFITTVKPIGAAARDGRLQPGDKILEINGNDLREVQHATAVEYFHNSGDTVKLLVERGAHQRISGELQPKPTPSEGRKNTTESVSSTWSRWNVIVPAVIIGTTIVAIIWYVRRRR